MSKSLEGQNTAQPWKHQQPGPGKRGRLDNLIAFRVRPEQLAFFRRLADYLHQNGFIPEPTLNRMAYVCMQMIGKKFEKQEADNLERYVNRRLADARAKVNPNFRDQSFLYAQGQPQPQQVRPQEYTQPPAQPRPVSTVPPSLKKPSVMPEINGKIEVIGNCPCIFTRLKTLRELVNVSNSHNTCKLL